MGLAETLGARAARKGRSAPVECGELGILTVEALPVRELELLLRRSDGQRAVFFAACRELQAAGEALRKAEKVFTPDGIMQFVSDSEAEAAAEMVLALSGKTVTSAPPKEEDGGAGDEADETKQEQVRTKPRLASEAKEEPFRLAPVQLEEGVKAPAVPAAQGENSTVPGSPMETEEKEDAPPPAETKREQAGAKADTASTKREQKRTFRLAPVQKTGVSDPGFGQVSRETMPEIAEFDTVPEPDKKAQAMGISSPERTQNVVPEEIISPAGDGSGGEPGDGLHETTSEFSEGLHETESEFRKALHETESEFQWETPEPMHETTSEFPAQAPQRVHETTSDFGEIRRDAPHEMKSEFQGEKQEPVHETESEFPEKDRAALHETTSELAEDVARRLLEGLRRAKWVRGD